MGKTKVSSLTDHTKITVPEVMPEDKLVDFDELEIMRFFEYEGSVFVKSWDEGAFDLVKETELEMDCSDMVYPLTGEIVVHARDKKVTKKK